MLPSLFLSSTAITLLTKGLFASSGISKNSSGSREPLLSLSSLLKFLYSFWSSSSVTKIENKIKIFNLDILIAYNSTKLKWNLTI